LEITSINPSNTELNPISHLLALLGAHHILHVSRIRVNDNVLNYIRATDSLYLKALGTGKSRSGNFDNNNKNKNKNKNNNINNNNVTKIPGLKTLTVQSQIKQMSQ